MKKALSLLIAVIVIGLFSIASPNASTAAAKSVILRVGYDVPPITAPGKGIEFWAREVTKETSGRVVVETYPAGALGGQNTGVEMLLGGVVDAYMLSIASNRKQFPISSIITLPGLGFPDTFAGQMDHVNTYMGLIDKYPAFAREYKDLEMVFHIVYSNAYLFTAKKEIRTPADVRGLKIGATGIRLQLSEMVGGAGVFTTPPQTYQNMQTGVINGVFINWGPIMEFNLYEVVGCALEQEFGGGGLPLIMSKRSWNKLSTEDQQISRKVAKEAQKVALQEMADTVDIGRKLFLDAGHNLITPNEQEKKLWEDKMAILWNKWINDNKAAGVVDAEAIFNEWRNASRISWGE